MNARHLGSAVPVSNVLGPNRPARDAASAELRPCGPSTSSACSTWSARSVCHTGRLRPAPARMRALQQEQSLVLPGHQR